MPLPPAAGIPHHWPHLLPRSHCFSIAEPRSLDEPAVRKTGGSRLTHRLILLLSEIRRERFVEKWVEQTQRTSVGPCSHRGPELEPVVPVMLVVAVERGVP